ncbi:MAG: response regulator [Taibaiella sp.]|nr:response regulator [Taibaiella sp.]
MEKVNSEQQQRSSPEFLSGGGEMGELIRSYDWGSTSLGSVDTWPQSLRTCVRIMLASRQPIWIGWGTEWIKLYNDAYKAIAGGKHPKALGQPAFDVWREIWEQIGPLKQAVMENSEGTYHESQLLIMERNGYPEETYYTFSYTPIPGDDGKTAGMFCANSDDTERIISERQLRTLTNLGKKLTDCTNTHEIIDQFIETIQENPFDFPFALFRIIDGANAKLVGSTDLDNATKYVPEVVALDASSPIAETIRLAIETRKPQVFENLCLRVGAMPKGAWHVSPDKAIALPIAQPANTELYGIVILGVNPFRLLDEKYMGFISLIADQLQQSFAKVCVFEEERKRALALAEIDQAKTAFFSNISHEFRTPLTLLLGPVLDVLNDPGTSEQNRKRLEVVHRNALRMQKLVNTLLEFSRLEAGRTEGRYRKVDIARLTGDLASTFRAAVEKAGMELRITAGEITADVYVDTEMWERIILNLVSNAFKYSKLGHIHIDSRQTGPNITITVSDTGIGIANEHLDRVFERFYRIEHSDGRSQEGTGIGLAMVKELVLFHKGHITAASEPGVGSVFTLTIPHGRQHLPQDKIIQEQGPIDHKHVEPYIAEALKWLPETTQSSEEAEHRSNRQVPTVLLADDNADMRDYVQRLLSDQFTVVTATDGEDGYAKAIALKPDLILSDVMMPRLDGLGLLKRIRANSELRHTPVIILSARAGEEAKIEGLDAGADDYLVKPFSAKELLVRVANHIRINLVRRQTEQQFYQLMMQAPALINVFIGPEHRFVLFHPKNKDILGNVDFTGLPLRDTLPELEWQGIFETFDKVYTTGESVEENERAVYVRGGNEEMQERYLNFVYKPWHDQNGNIMGVMNFAVDVTETVIARKKIEESEERFRLLAETLPQLIWTMDEEGEMVYASSRWREYTGIDPEPDNWEKIVHPNDLKTVNDAWEKSRRTLRPYRTEVRLRNRNGKYRWFSGQGEPILKDNGEVDRWIGGFTDIHDQKEIEASLERLVAERTLELKRSNESLQQFAHVASHDLKEPVRKIKTFSSRLQHEYGEALPEKGKLFLEKIHSATDRMYAMIEGVLNYSTIDAQDQHTTQVDLNEIIRNIEADLELSMQQKKAIIVKDNLPSIEGASVLLYQLFYNLIGNSLKFASTERTPVINIRCSDDRDGKYAKIELSDNGIGFASEYSRKIFNTFSRLNPKDQYEGTGLGLALCKKIAERHNGSIQARGEEREGAIFTILLPYRQLKEIV